LDGVAVVAEHRKYWGVESINLDKGRCGEEEVASPHCGVWG